MNLAPLTRYSSSDEELHYKGREIRDKDIIMRSGPKQIIFGWSKLFSQDMLKGEIENAALLFSKKVKEKMKKREEKGEPPVKWRIVYEYGGDVGMDSLKSYVGTYEFYAVRRDALIKERNEQLNLDFYR